MTGLSSETVARWRAAIGRQERRSELLAADSLRRFALSVGSSPEVEACPPPLAHWAFFLPAPADEAIGPDGHPRRGDFLPDISLPRRMFAASQMEFAAPLAPGRQADLVTTITDVAHKAGRSGDLVFVEIERVISQAGRTSVRETQSYVYRGESAPTGLPEPAIPAPDGEKWLPDEVNLFRFSAATFNGHRIHYDLPYAKRVEGYPALVVHGPFTAAKLAALAERGGALASFSFRAMAPLFLGQPIYLREAGDGTAEAVRCDGTVAMRAEFTRR